jgi:hypothetical protein
MKRSQHHLGRAMALVCVLAAVALCSRPLCAADRLLACLPGPAGKDLACFSGTDDLLTVFYTGSGTAAGPGRVAWITGLSTNRTVGAAGGLLPPGREGEAMAYGPAALLLPGDTRPSAAWVERQDGGCRLFLSRPAVEAGRWSVPEPVLPRPVDLIRFLDGAGTWLVWVESQTYDDDIVACHRGPQGWEQPVAISLGDDSEDLAPRIALHPSGVPWVVWAGARDGGRDEILLSRLRGKEWVREVLVSREDDTPDVLPDLAISPGGLACAVWLGYARETRDYQVTASFSSDGESWSEEILLGQGSFARPPKLARLDDGRFLLLWSDAAGTLWHAEQNGERWSSPREVQLSGSDAAAPKEVALLLFHRSNRGDGSLVAVPRLLP